MDDGLSDYLRWFATDHQRDLAAPYLDGRPTTQQADVLHQLADVLVDIAAQSPTSIAGGLLVAARALEKYTERCVRG